MILSIYDPYIYRERVCVCVCVCGCERERERGRERERERGGIPKTVPLVDFSFVYMAAIFF